MDDVARVAAVSRKTVSRVINGAENVSRGTRERVLQVIEELGYTPHVTAQSLARGTSRCIGVAIGHGADFAFSNPHLGQVLNGIGVTAASRGYQVLLVTQDVPGTPERLVSNHQVDGLLFMSVKTTDPVVISLQKMGVPLILTCQHVNPDIAFVDVNNRKGAILAVQHLLTHGHRAIGFIDGPLAHASCRERLAGYKDALEDAGLNLDEALIMEGDFSEESGFRKTFALLESSPDITAVFAVSDLMALGAVRALVEAGLRVPEDVSVIGFDGIPLTRYLNPPLTTIFQSPIEKGKLAAEMLLQRLTGEPARNQQIFLEPELLVRATTGPAKRALA